MRKLIGSLLLLLALTALWTATPVWAKKHPANPIPADVSPQWVLIPQSGGVQYAPNLPTDLFSFGGNFYYYFNSLWYVSPAVSGPWQQIPAPPPVFYQIEPTYFKTPPGWTRGKKTGWRGAPMPPGQMKKYSP